MIEAVRVNVAGAPAAGTPIRDSVTGIDITPAATVTVGGAVTMPGGPWSERLIVVATRAG